MSEENEVIEVPVEVEISTTEPAIEVLEPEVVDIPLQVEPSAE